MTRAFLYFHARTRRNRIVGLLRRLKDPRYAVGVVAFLAYMAFMGVVLFAGTAEELSSITDDKDVKEGALSVGTYILTGLILSTVLMTVRSSGREPGLAFQKAELMFLIGAPVSRRGIIGFWLWGLQPGLFFSSLVVALFSARATGRFLTGWLVAYLGFNAVVALSLALKMLTCALRERGVGDFIQRAPFRIFALAIFVAVSLAHEPYVDQEASDYAQAFLDTEPLHTILWPFVQLARGFLAETLVEALPVLAVVAVFNVVTLGLALARPPHFEEAALQITDRVETFKQKGWLAWRKAGKKKSTADDSASAPRDPPFALAPGGPVFVALVWKNVIGTGRLHRARYFLPALVGVLLVSSIVGELLPQGPAPGIASVVVGYSSLIGVLLLIQQSRHDLRRDLPHFATLKSYPLTGRQLLQGEVLGLSLVASAWAILGCASVAGLLVGVGGGDEWHPVSWFLRAPVLLCLWIVLPALVYMTVSTQNVVALMWPAWAHVGAKQVVGVANFGGQLVGMLVLSLVLALASIVPSIVGALLYGLCALAFASDSPSPPVWAWCALPAAAAFAAILVVEAQLLLRFAEPEYAAFDVALEAGRSDS